MKPEKFPSLIPDINRRSLIGRALRMAALRIGIVVGLAGFVSYGINRKRIEETARGQLLLSASERLQREDAPFAEVADIERNFMREFMESHADPERRAKALAAFDDLFVLDPDGAWRERPGLYDGQPTPGGLRFPQIGAVKSPGTEPLTDDCKARMVLAVEWVHRYGNILRGRHLNFSATLPEHVLVMYAPEIPFNSREVVFSGKDAFQLEDYESFILSFNRKEDGFGVTPMYLDPTINTWMVTAYAWLAHPPDGAKLASVSLDISLGKLMERSANPGIPGCATIILRDDPDGKLIHHPARLEEIKTSKGTASAKSTGDPELLAIQNVAQSIPVTGDTRLIETDGSFVAVGKIPSADWILALSYPKHLTRPAILSNLAVVGAVGLLTLVIEIFILHAILKNQVGKPLTQLNAAARRLGNPESNFDTGLLPADSPDEIGDLAESFRNMAEQLRTSFASVRAGEEKFHAVLEASPLAISWMNSRGEMEFWNRKALDLFGYDREQIDTAEKWFILAYPDPEYRKAVIERWNASGASGPDGHIDRGEYDITCKDGRIVTTEIVGTRLGDLTLAIFNDITERKLAEEELRRSEARFKLLSDVSPLAIVVAEGPDQSFEYMNPKFTELLGYTREDLPDVSHWWPQAYPDLNYRRQVVEEWTWKVNQASLSKTHITEPVESEVTCKDGSTKTILWGFAVVSDNKSIIYGMDLTARKEAERELKRVSDRLQVATRAADIGIWDWDVVGNELFWDDAMYRLYGIRREDFGGAYDAWTRVLHPEDRQRVEDAIQAALRGEREYNEEFRIIRPDGSLRFIQAAGQTFRDAEGKPIRMVGVNYNTTARRLAEEELRSSRLMLLTVLDSFPGVVFWKDLHSVYVGSNQTFARAAGFSEPAELVGKTDFDLPWADIEAAAYVADDRRVMEEGVPRLGIIETQKQADGSTTWFDTGKVPLRDHQGKVIGVMGTSIDITARKLAEEELRRHRDHLEELVDARTGELAETNTSLEKTVQELGLYRYMLDKASTAVYLIDRSGRFIYINECAAQYSGYTREELLLMRVGDLNIAHTEESWDERWKTVDELSEGELDVTRMIHRRKDGSTYPIEILAHHIRHEGRDYQLSIGIDISERERAEEELIAINVCSDQALELTRSGYWVVPLDGSPDFTSSERAAMIFGDLPNSEWRYTVEHWLSCIEAVDPQIRAETARKFFATCAGEMPVYDAIYPYKRPRDGRVVWLHGLGTIIHREGRPPQMYGVVQDVTEIVENRRELEEARKAAEKANRAKSTFLATMSHEIRTPMNGVLGMAELLSRTPLESGQREQLAMLKNSGEDLLTVINDILDFSKIEAGRMELETIGFSLHDLLGRTLQALVPQAAAKKLEIELDIPDDLPDLRLGDPNRLRQVLTNLVGNAVKFTERGWVRVVVTQGDGPDGLRVEVTDTGEGISPEAQAKLFQPFSQADASTTRKHGGTGLGLVISARIIEQMGGRTGVTSALGHGSTFWFELALPPAAPGQVSSLDDRMSDALPQLAGKRVLLVDDNSVNRAVASALMRRWRMEVSEAIDGPSALTQVRAVSSKEDAGFDLAVMDGAMPGMDGWQLATAIRKIPGCGALPMVMASSSGLETAHSVGENSLFRRFLLKPLRPAQLAGALAEALTGWQPRRAATITKADRAVRVLLVEDTKVNQMVARAMLEKGGHQVTLAENGVEALALLEQPDLFDVVLMDCQMPEMDGFEATRQLRLREQERGWQRYRVVAMTANAMQSDKEACLEAGMDDYLSKPVRMDQLLNMVTGGNKI